MIDVAPTLQAAAAAIEERRWADAAAHLIAAWEDCKIERIARTLAAVDLRLPPPKPLEEKRVNRREWEFHELVKTGDPEDLRRALAAPWPSSVGQAEDRVLSLSKVVSPRISNALLALHRGARYSSVSGTRLSRAIFHLLIDQHDHAVVGELERFERIPHEHERLGAAVFRRRRPVLPYLSPAGEEALSAIERLLAETRTTAESLLAAIYETPADDGPRIVYADALTEAGDLRGEFITLQIQRGSNGKPTPRERKLLADAGRSWLDGLDDDGATKIVHERGFPAIATLAAGEIRALGWATIETLYLASDTVFSGAPQLRGLRELHGLNVDYLSAVKLPSYELDALSLRSHAIRLGVDTELAPKTLGLGWPVVPDLSLTMSRLRTLPIGRRVETVRTPLGLRDLPSIIPLVEQTGYTVEITGAFDVTRENQWAGRITPTSLSLRWVGNTGLGDVAYATIVAVLSGLTPPFEDVEITGEAPDTPKVRDALMRIVDAWPRLRSAKILGLETPLTN